MCCSLTSKPISCRSPLSKPIDATIRCAHAPCQHRRVSRTRAKSSFNSPTRPSKRERPCSQCTDQSSECVGHPLGNVTVFQTSAIAPTLTNETEPPHRKCHTDAPCCLHGGQETSHSMLHTDKAMSKPQSRRVSHKKPTRQSHPPKHQHQDLRLWWVNLRQPINSMSCMSCQTEVTPRWRKGPSGPRTLCNFCGLIYAKRQQKYHDAPSSHCFSSD
ncbi:GATA zinc finger domain protein [Fusarium sp. NRRL 52700]|nr:GATA zinc finger domain protein [Fusarium sp. NRRL 52700]